MKITLAEWSEMAMLQLAAQQALAALETSLITHMVKYFKELPELEHLTTQLERCDSVKSDICALGNNVRPISERVGGEAWKWREPDILGLLSSRRYFTDEEVAEFEAWKEKTAQEQHAKLVADLEASST